MKNVLSNNERIILENIDEQYQWIARDENGSLWVYNNKPQKNETMWIMRFHTNGWESFIMFNHLFQMVQWEDKEPTIIAKLLKEK